MASSDDEVETVPRDVSDYEFLFEDTPVSFAELPLERNRGGTLDPELKQIFLRGNTDNGLQRLYKEVIAWKFDLSCMIPEISVLSVDGHWIKLLKPRKPFEGIVRTILVTVHLLHFVKWNPQASEKSMWERLAKTFSTPPSKDDLVDHMSLIHEALKRDGTLAKSKLLSTLLADKPRKRKPSTEGNPRKRKASNEDSVVSGRTEDESDEVDYSDNMCAICDNGGEMIICCDGKCMRSFHATKEDGEDSQCTSVGFTIKEFKVLKEKDVPFYCKNCEYKQHQCFSCGHLGSSDESSGAEVFRCVNGACGHFYHPDCVSKLLHPDDVAAAKEHSRKIAAGEQFVCPVHKCHVCKESEVRTKSELQFAICRRCPRAYHRKCLPRGVAFEKDVYEGRAPIQRAWEGLLTNHILIYCLKHKIDERILTPVRNHIKFPDPQKVKRKLPIESSEAGLLKGRSFDGNSARRNYAKPSKELAKVTSDSKQGDVLRKREEKFPLAGFSKKQKVAIKRDSPGNSKDSATTEGMISLGDSLYAAYGLDTGPVKPSCAERAFGEHEKTRNNMPANRISDMVTLEDDAKERILTLIGDAYSSVTLEEIKRKHKRPSTYSQSLKFLAENISSGRVVNSVQALRTALEYFNKGGTIEDAKAICGDDLLVQILNWKDKLKVYLAPFLHGKRYTSFGRHFTKTDKLKEIVDMLHWYMQDGDMMVDFCCGSNDFSCLVKKKLDEVGKTCSFKNYDILQAKNDFCFEKKDWMTVDRNELPDGSRLIMGLNPPFGTNAAFANKFIDKALEFKPKLLILIVPHETQRLDEKQSRYDLIWEDDQLLAGKAFYLPGSINVNEKQIEDWNVNAPSLYLWSAPDWTPKHKAIAEQHGHPFQKKYKLEESPCVMQVYNQFKERHNVDESRNQVKDGHLEKKEVQNHVPIAEQHGHPFQKKYKLEECPRVMQVSNQFKERHNVDESRNQVKDGLLEKKEDQNHDLIVTGGHQEGLSSDKKGDNVQLNNHHSEANWKKKNKKKRKRGSVKKVNNYHSEANLNDTSSNKKKNKKRKRGLDKRVMVEKFFGKRSVALHRPPDRPHDRLQEANPSKHLERHSRVHAGWDRSVSVHPSPGWPSGRLQVANPPKHLEMHSPVLAGRDHSVSVHPSSNLADGGNSLVVYSTEYLEKQSHVRAERNDDYHGFGCRSFPPHQSYSQTGEGNNEIDDLVGKYSSTGEETNIVPYKSYPGEMGQNCGRSPTFQSHVNVNVREGLNLFNQKTECPPYSGFVYPSSHGQQNPASNPAYGVMTTSATQHCTVRLDDLNHGQTNARVSGGSVLDATGTDHRHVSRPGTEFGILGFAPGPYRPHSNNSLGWLDE